jgi:tetratricopeptide (TPR) repeat protein
MNRAIKTGIVVIVACSGSAHVVANAQVAPIAGSEESEALSAEADFHLAESNNDVKALRNILADDYYGIDQYGVRSEKEELLSLFGASKASSLTQHKANVRLSGDIAIVTGSITEEHPKFDEKLVFVRVFTRRSGRWQLLSNAQFIPVVPDELHGVLLRHQQALERNPRSSLAHYRIGEEFLREKNYQSAANEFREALNGDLEPKWVEVWAYINLGKIYDATGQRERAINEYTRAQLTKDDTRGALAEAAACLKAPCKP